MAAAPGTSSVSHPGDHEPIGELLRTKAPRREWEQAGEPLLTGDGAPWIWNQSELVFPNSEQLVGWYHAKSHLVEAGRLLKGGHTRLRPLAQDAPPDALSSAGGDNCG